MRVDAARLDDCMYLFAYGTLQDPARVRAVVGSTARVRVLGRGTIRGILYDAGDYPVLQQSGSARDVVPGVLLELGDDSLAALDRYEGVAAGLYVRRRVEVCVDGTVPQQAWGYVYNRCVAGLRRIDAWPPRRGGSG